MIDQREGDHGLGDGYRAGCHAGVVTSFNPHYDLFSRSCHGFLSFADGGGGFNDHSQNNVGSVRDAA